MDAKRLAVGFGWGLVATLAMSTVMGSEYYSNENTRQGFEARSAGPDAFSPQGFPCAKIATGFRSAVHRTS